jgi:ABC-type multidrug transport system permease subunit
MHPINLINWRYQNMKHHTKLALMSAAGIALSAGNALAAGDLTTGNLTAADTSDIVNNLGLFSGMGKFVLEYAVHICVFFMVVCTIMIYGKGLYARSNKKATEALEERENLKGLLIDSVIVMLVLIVLFNVVVPYISAFVPK